LLVIVDRATCWIEAKPVKTLDAKETAQALVELIVERHGVPKVIVSDRGGAYNSELLAEVARLCGFKQSFCSAYNPQSNGFVERRNQILKKMLRVFCLDCPRKWDQSLGSILFAMRTCPLERVGYSPAFLLYGRELTVPVHLLLPTLADRTLRSSDNFLLNKLQELQNARAIVFRQRGERREAERQYEITKFGEADLKVGDFVLLHHPAERSKRGAKLLAYFTGPHEVVGHSGDNSFDLMVEGRVGSYNLRRMVKCTSEVARRHLELRPGGISQRTATRSGVGSPPGSVGALSVPSAAASRERKIEAEKSPGDSCQSVNDKTVIGRSRKESSSALIRPGQKRRWQNGPEVVAKRPPRPSEPSGPFVLVRKAPGRAVLVETKSATRGQVWRAKARNVHTFAPSWLNEASRPTSTNSRGFSPEEIGWSVSDIISSGFKLVRASLPATVRGIVRDSRLVLEAFTED